MLIENKILVTGIRCFEGEVDGTQHNFTKMAYSVLGDGVSNDREKGSWSKEVLVGDSKTYKDLSKYDYPALFDVTFNLVQTRKGIDLKLEDYSFLKSIEI